MDLQSLKEECFGKWNADFAIDKRLRCAYDNLEAWLSQIPEEFREISTVLIKNLDYYSQAHTNKLLVDLHEALLKQPSIKANNTIYAYIKSRDGKTNSSNEYWTMYKMVNNINSEYVYEDMSAITKNGWPHVENIVFIDDFSGTGKSFIDELKKCEKRYKGKKIYFITICIMDNAIKEIEDYAKLKRFCVKPVYSFVQQKVFDRNLFDDNIKAKEVLIELSNKLNIPKNQKYLGFQDTEALVAFHNNTPNNTLALIRYESASYKPPFPRIHFPKPPWDTLKKDRKKRQVSNYNNKLK